VRDHQPSFQSRFVSSTPTSTIGASEPDASLRRRFHKVEVIGSGEFSQVYRVTQVVAPSPPQAASFRPSTPVANASIVRRHDRVYAVKKSRRPYLGARDRKRKLQEVEILQSLGHSDHVVHLIDSWEEHDHLYIQTEFCEEGSLDLFLTQVGRKARLDDFRIWKIMLELCLVIHFSMSISYDAFFTCLTNILWLSRECSTSMTAALSIWISNRRTY
jgi:mitosis inhibitor protein kinase SWE1